MSTKDSWIDEFFFGFAKIIIFIPLIIFLIGLYVKYSYKPSATKTILISQISPTATKQKLLDLDGPLICQYSSKEASISAFIKNKQIYGEKIDKLKTNRYLLVNDCLYIWEKDKLVGKKTCGLGQYLNLISFFSSFQTIDNLEKLIPSEVASYSAEIKNIIKACEKEQIKNEEIFKVPKNVRFD